MISSFKNEYGFLSNFYPVEISYEGLSFLSVEAAFQACKTLDKAQRLIFTNLPPRGAKLKGRAIFLREDWEEVKDGIMYDLCKLKFTENEDLKKQLLETGNRVLIEGNHHGDRYWGVVDGVGKNRLGKILMMIREEIKEWKF